MDVVMDEKAGITWFLIDDNVEFSVYVVPIGNSPGWLKVVSLILMDRDESRSLRAVKSLRCFTGIFTELSDSELPNSTVTGVTYRSLMNFISAV